MRNSPDSPSKEKQPLVERHLISRELAARSEGARRSHLTRQNASILFNEEDHLRLQYILPGIQLKKHGEPSPK